jgi:Protein of unknown function (DUF1360)
VANELEKLQREYAPRDQVPLAGYVASMLTFAAGLGGILVWVTRKKAPLPSLLDVALLGVATHKLSRILSKDFVTAPLRAPFTRRQGPEGAGEVHDEPRGGGLRRATGYLLTCPYCLGPWIGTSLCASLLGFPLQTRFVLRVLSAVTVSDFLHLSYSRLNESRKTVVAERRLVENHVVENHVDAALESAR